MTASPAGAPGFVRAARASDADGIAHIQVASWQATLGGLVPAEVLAGLSDEAALAQWRDRWLEAITKPPTSRHKVLVAYPAGSPAHAAGFASLGPATDPDRWPGTDGELYELHVLPEAAGAGHGARLLHAAAGTLAEDGFHTAYTWALAEDSARLEFLRTAGWAPDGAAASLDMGAKVPVVRLHTVLSPE